MQVSSELTESTEKRLKPFSKILASPQYQSRASYVSTISADRLARRTRALAADGVTPSKLEFERILGSNDLVDINYLERGLQVSRAVCRIILLGPGGGDRGYATGFMVSPRLLLTNHHVFPSFSDAEGAIAEFNYELDILGHPKPTTRFNTSPGVYFWANEELDFALVAIDPTPTLGSMPLAEFGWLRLNPQIGKINETEFVSLVQHPGGSPKECSIRENQLIKIENTTLVYKSDTAPGSSGSPVFNDSWQVVGLHHSSVPAKDGAGQILGPDDKPAPDNAADNQIKWIGNEGIRISCIVDRVRDYAPPSDLITELLQCSAIRQDWAPIQPSMEALPVATVADRAIGNEVVLRLRGPLQLSIGSQEVGPVTAPSFITPGKAITPPAIEPTEALKLDPNYSKRLGYVDNLLGAVVPLPHLSDIGVKLVFPRKDGQVFDHKLPFLQYHHFSLVMNKERHMLFFAASNFDCSPARRGTKSRKQLGIDNWVFDPRIDNSSVVAKDFYAHNPLDFGHVVRREDNYWGETPLEAEYANTDTFTLTNSTPQHQGFNRSQEKGLWGELENFITKKAKVGSDRLVLFAGPVFSKTDRNYHDVLVPKQFWKVVVAPVEPGAPTEERKVNGQNGRQARRRGSATRAGIKAFGFLLSQEHLIDNMEEFAVDAEFKPYQVPLSKIEQMTEVRFDATVLAADVLAHEKPSHRREINRLEDISIG
jgi:endonuclease G, mitochondrial